MDQSHIGYTAWFDPPFNRMPFVKYVSPDSAQVLANVMPAKSVSAENKVPAGINYPVFYELNKYISIDADHFSKAVGSAGISWQVLPDHGRTGSAVTTMPVTAEVRSPGNQSPHLEYEVYTYDAGSIKLQLYFSPSLNINNDEGLRYAVSVDNETPQIVSINKDDSNTRTWEEWMRNNIITKTTEHNFTTPGRHIIKYWMVSPAVVLQKIVGDMGGVRPSYLGPPETRSINKLSK